MDYSLLPEVSKCEKNIKLKEAKESKVSETQLTETISSLINQLIKTQSKIIVGHIQEALWKKQYNMRVIMSPLTFIHAKYL